MKISNLLSKGAENAVTRQALANLTGWDERTLRRAIHEERKLGAPIVSDCQSGYFLAANEYDLVRFRHSMQHRAGEIMKIVQATDDLLERMTGQLRIGG